MAKKCTFLLLCLCLFDLSNAELKAVFAHYMVGTMQPYQAAKDVADAKALGIDAFAINVHSTDTWSTNTIRYLFDAAVQHNFKLFFSFDMNHFNHPSQFLGLIEQWCRNPAYYLHIGLPFVSTFYGGTMTFGESRPSDGWQKHYREPLQAKGIWTYFVPAFSNARRDNPSGFTWDYPVVDGVMNWDGAWPQEWEGKVNISMVNDKAWLTDTHTCSNSNACSKTFMMAISPVQFKHMSSSDNWYLRGELNLGTRMAQVLSLAPDFLELITWNDAGESHYFSTIWPDPIAGSNIHTYTDGYDHSGWQILLPPLIKSYKAGTNDISTLVPSNGKRISGVFWYRTILTTGSCANDPMGKPRGWQNAEDNFNLIVLADEHATQHVIHIYSGNSLLTVHHPVKGLNSWSIPGIRTGAQRVDIVEIGGHIVASGSGKMDVVNDIGPGGICNYNYQVAELKLIELPIIGKK